MLLNDRKYTNLNRHAHKISCARTPKILCAWLIQSRSFLYPDTKSCVIAPLFNPVQILSFPMEPFARVQLSSCCYIISACTWYSLMLQRHMPDAKQAEDHIDVTQCARHMVVVIDDDTLVNHVIHPCINLPHPLAARLFCNRLSCCPCVNLGPFCLPLEFILCSSLLALLSFSTVGYQAPSPSLSPPQS